MNDTQFDLRSFRENILRMTQMELANALELRQDTISRMEKNPEQITYPVIAKMATISGQTIDQVVRYAPPKPNRLSVERTWTIGYDVSRIRKNVQDFLKNNPALRPEQRALFNGLERTLAKAVRKPVVAVGGGLCSGKGTLINNLLGESLIPVSAVASNPMIIHVKHIDDRPAFMTDSVHIMRRTMDGIWWENGFLNDEQRCSAWQTDYGGQSKLSQARENAYALVFTESDILKNCDLIKLPVQTPDASADPDIMNIMDGNTDILLYLLPASGFGRDADMADFALYMRGLRMTCHSDFPETGKLDNLFLIVSKAKLYGTVETAVQTAAAVSEKVFEGISRTFRTEQWTKTGTVYGKEDFVSRLFPYDAYGGAEWRERFENEFRRIVEKIPQIIEEEIKSMIRGYCSAACRSLTANIDRWNMLRNQNTGSLDIDALEQAENRRWSVTAQAKDRAVDMIRKSKAESFDQFAVMYSRIISEQNVSTLLADDASGYTPAQIQFIGMELASRLEEELRKLLGLACEEADTAVDRFIQTYEMPPESNMIDAFSARGEFAAGLQNLESIGALSGWLASQGKEIAVLDPDLLKFASQAAGGKTANPGFSSGIPGAVPGMADIFAAITGAGMGNVFVNGKTPVRKVCAIVYKAYSDSEVRQRYTRCIERYWNDTLTAFHTAADRLESAWEAYLKQVRENPATRTGRAGQIESRIAAAEKVKTFFEHLTI